MGLFVFVKASVLSVLVALACAKFSSCHVVKGSVTCLDCNHDLSGVKVAVKCNREEKLAFAFTDEKGFFQADLPLNPSSSSSSPSPSPKCFAMLLGGPKQLWTHKKNLVSKITKAQQHDAYTIATPLTFFSSCPQTHLPHSTKAQDSSLHNPKAAFESSKTIDIPLPREWGLAPSSYYFPFIPIIGIP